MNEEKYYLDEIKITDGSVLTMVISCETHIACIKIHSSPEDAVERLNKVLKGLNE